MAQEIDLETRLSIVAVERSTHPYSFSIFWSTDGQIGISLLLIFAVTKELALWFSIAQFGAPHLGIDAFA